MSDRLIVSVSGGADSTAIALLLHERGEDFELLFADTGAELPEVYWFLPRLAQYVGKPLHVVSDGGFYKFLSGYGYLLPGNRCRWCTRVLKMIPLDFWMAAEKIQRVAVGIRADEPKRQRQPERRAGEHETTWPLVDAGMGKSDVKALCAKHDMLIPVYEWRTNVSCFCCPFQRKADWRGLLKHHPNLYAVAEEWERQSIRTTEKGFTWSHWPLDKLRTATKAQIDMWPEQEEQPCLICTA